MFSFLVYFLGCLPQTLFKAPTSTILLSKEGRLMNAQIAKDGQWRFPPMDSLPQKFKDAIVTFEDRSFYQHPGISIKGISRAVIQNFKALKVLSGGSTITMQIARLSRKGGRNIWNKIIESIWALRLEFKYSKDDLLNIYAANAPFGGNVVGLEAASWRYFGLSPYELSWAEMAMLAVLPNAPSLIHPGKNRSALLLKRNKLLENLFLFGKIDKLTYELSIEEPLIAAPKNLPNVAPHLLSYAIKNGQKGKRITSTIVYDKQTKFNSLLARHQKYLDHNYIHNMALIVIDVKSNEVITYIGNTAHQKEHQNYVDINHAPRSSGSILKPFLFTAMIQEGLIQNHQLIPDVPMSFNHFSPKNYDGKYKGAVKVEEALSQSLNVPAVYLLKQYGVNKFLHKLRDIGQTKMSNSAKHYGLSLILGGAETTLWDITNTYAKMSKTLNFYNANQKYQSQTWEDAQIFEEINQVEEPYPTSLSATQFDAGSIYQVFETLLEVNRPYFEASWKNYSSSHKIAWKTGTSFGNRDAWAVGCTPDYVVGVWVGNASGEGRPGIIGTTAAGPVLFDVFAHLNIDKNWFAPPYEELTQITICKESGYISGQNCSKIDTVWAHKNAIRSESCHFHKTILTDEQEQFRFYQDCTGKYNTKLISPFVLPPLQAYFYKNSHPNYKNLPPFHPNCIEQEKEQTFTVVYPKPNSNIISTIDLNGEAKGIVLEASHPNSQALLFWHIDNHFLDVTKGIHKLKYNPTEGQHTLTVVDEAGNQKQVEFTILSK